MATRTASTHWEGGLQQGAGRVTLDTSGVGSYDVSWRARADEDAGGSTSPEELVAAAHASCYSMQLSGILEKAGTAPQSLDTTADVSFGKRGEGYAITGILLRVAGVVPGASDEDFQAAAQKAKEICPVSAALAGTEISLEAKLAG
jgi:osmotically inducible protein OsmC